MCSFVPYTNSCNVHCDSVEIKFLIRGFHFLSAVGHGVNPSINDCLCHTIISLGAFNVHCIGYIFGFCFHFVIVFILEG